MNYILMNEKMARRAAKGDETRTIRVVERLYDISLKDYKKHPISFKGAPEDLEFTNLQGLDTICSLFYSKSKNKSYCGDNIKYKKGDIIWVREPAIVTNYISRYDSTKIDYQLKSDKTKEYRIDLPMRFLPNPKKWITECKSVPYGCIFEMSKTFLVITGIKAERVQNIGCNEIKLHDKTSQKGYMWKDNPFVITYDFKRIEYSHGK